MECNCERCDGAAVSAGDFEDHGGCKSKHPSESIYIAALNQTIKVPAAALFLH